MPLALFSCMFKMLVRIPYCLAMQGEVVKATKAKLKYIIQGHNNIS